jgi:glycosyltransferase involved in cell wall biosynthesis
LESVCTINFRKEMKIVINDYAGHPFQVQLSRELACNGHSVLHTYFASDITPRGNLQKGANDSTNLHIKGLSLGYKFKKYSFIQRRKSEIKFGELVVIEIQKFEPEVIICSNTPLDPLKNISKYCKSNNIKVIIWLQDIISVGISHILRKKYGYFALPVGLYYKTIEKKILHDAKHIIGISSGFSDFLDSIQIDQSKISYISNWSPINEIPICEKVNSWSECNSLSDKTVLLYAGTLGMKHNPQLLIDLAESFKDDATVIIVIITEGLGASYIEQKIQTKKLTNILLLPFQPFSDLPEVLGSADVLLAILEKEAGKYSVPSKILTYFCSNRPVLLSVPNDNLIYQIVEENSPGVAIDAYSQTSTEDFISSARELVNRPNLRNQLGKNGRQYAEDNFSIKKIASKFLQIINPK